jgi:cytochrome P450
MGPKVKSTVFREILSSKNLTAIDKAHQRLADEANILVAAGVETTAFALCVGVFHIVNTPQIYSRLKEELFDSLPEGDSKFPSLVELEKLLYLKACIQESLRLSYGISARNPRRHPDRDLNYKGRYKIPKGTKISMTIVDVHHDETIYPDSHRFHPERWLDDPKAPDGRPLDHYLMAFGKGPRLCLGMNLAWAELFFAMAMMFRRFDYRLYQTDESDVRYKYDFFTPRVKLDSKGVRVLVL